MFREKSRAVLLVHTFEQPLRTVTGVLDDQLADGQQESIARLNRGIRAEATRHPGIYLVNYDALTARHGRLRWHDERRWRTLRMPLGTDAIDALAQEYMRFLHPISGRVCKVLAIDLDNTLWHGIVGEDGVSGIRMDAEYPGSAYRAVQRAARDLKRRGIMLAVCSRNNPDEALDVLRTHPDMLLRPDDFAAIRIGWEDKDVMLREIARELNIGVEAIAFFDDNPRERDLVRMRLPEAVVLDAPEDPVGYADVLRAAPVFERLAIAAEDVRRDQLVVGERQRSALRTSAASLEEFYRSLETRVEVGRADQRTIPRIAQLTQKTNQFNLTTRRYSDAQVAAMAADPATRVLWMRVVDRFGDAGLVGVAILRLINATADIEAFLLSCRVIGRTAETALLSTAAAEARASGAVRLTGSFAPTAKNEPARDFFRAHRFTMTKADEAGTRWEYDLSGPSIDVPPWIECAVASIHSR
jgi:FkbH-like protein